MLLAALQQIQMLRGLLLPLAHCVVLIQQVDCPLTNIITSPSCQYSHMWLQSLQLPYKLRNNAMQCHATRCTALHCTALHCTALQCNAMFYNATQSNANAKQCNARQCNTAKDSS
jgi:hypothetical protein